MDVMASFGLTGRQAETILREARLTVNRNSIPQDINGPWYTSGIRMGTPAMTTLGMKEREMREIASLLVDLLKCAIPEIVEKTNAPSKAKAKVPQPMLQKTQERVNELLSHFPLYPELCID